MDEYYMIRFEVDKLHTIFSSYYDAQAMLQFNFKVFSEDTIESLLDLYELLSTIKPVFETNRPRDLRNFFTLFT